jgi:hypothetical protein
MSRAMSFKENRMRVTNEIISNIKIIKLWAIMVS